MSSSNRWFFEENMLVFGASRSFKPSQVLVTWNRDTWNRRLWGLSTLPERCWKVTSDHKKKHSLFILQHPNICIYININTYLHIYIYMYINVKFRDGYPIQWSPNLSADIYIYIYSIKNNKNMFMIIYNVCILPFSVRKYGPSTRMCGCSTAVLD